MKRIITAVAVAFTVLGGTAAAASASTSVSASQRPIVGTHITSVVYTSNTTGRGLESDGCGHTYHATFRIAGHSAGTDRLVITTYLPSGSHILSYFNWANAANPPQWNLYKVVNPVPGCER